MWPYIAQNVCAKDDYVRQNCFILFRVFNFSNPSFHSYYWHLYITYYVLMEINIIIVIILNKQNLENTRPSWTLCFYASGFLIVKLGFFLFEWPFYKKYLYHFTLNKCHCFHAPRPFLIWWNITFPMKLSENKGFLETLIQSKLSYVSNSKRVPRCWN